MKLITKTQKYLIGVLLTALLVFTSFVSLPTPAYAGSANVREATDQNFESEVLKSNIPVLVNFSATWAGPSKALAPIVGQVADQYQGKIKVYNLDIDDNPETARKYGVRSVPTLQVFKKGEKVANNSGLTSREKIVQLLGLY